MRDGRGGFYRQLRLDPTTWKAVNFFRRIRLEMLKENEKKRVDKQNVAKEKS